MSADLLRRAAEKLREHANAATPGPWGAHATDSDGQTYVTSRAPENGEKEAGGFKALTVEVTSHDGNFYVDLERQQADAEFIETMHPPVALALAELLDDMADLIEVFPRDDEMAGTQKLVALARTILREPQ